VKAKIDEVLCTGHGRCFVLASEVYDLDDDGYNKMRGAVIDVAPQHEDAARLGADNCPEAAITLIED
jgi:ferredoxin